MTDAPIVVPDRSRGRIPLIAGLGLAGLGVVIYFALFRLGRLSSPWYMPVLALNGVGLILVSIGQRRTAFRVSALAAVVLLAVLETAFLFAVRLPAYAGPIAEGRPFPAFLTARADGSKFTQDDLVGDQNHVLVFFRGRW